MGRAGPLPQPDNVRALRGNPGKRKPLPTIKARPGIPSKPTRVKGEAAREWHRITPELEATGRLALIDRAVLAVYCLTWGQFCELSDIVGSEYLRVGHRNALAKHPAWQQLRDCRHDLLAQAKELGLSPNARLRMTLANEGDHDGGDSPFD